MIAASSSTAPSRVRAAPWPALNDGSSSSIRTAALTASRLLPPRSSSAKPPSSAASRPARERCSRGSDSSARGTAPAPPWMAIAYMFGSRKLLLCITVHGDVPPAARIARAAKHADAVEVHGDVAASVHGDHAALAPAAAQLLVDDFAHRLRQRQVPILHQRADVVGHHLADEEFALSGAGDRAGGIVGVGAGPHDGRIPDPPAVLVGEPPGGGGGGEMAGAIEGDGAHGAGGPWRGRLELPGLRLARLVQLACTRLGAEVLAGHEHHALLERELFGALGHEQHVRAL